MVNNAIKGALAYEKQQENWELDHSFAYIIISLIYHGKYWDDTNHEYSSTLANHPGISTITTQKKPG